MAKKKNINELIDSIRRVSAEVNKLAKEKDALANTEAFSSFKKLIVEYSKANSELKDLVKNQGALSKIIEKSALDAEKFSKIYASFSSNGGKISVTGGKSGFSVNGVNVGSVSAKGVPTADIERIIERVVSTEMRAVNSADFKFGKVKASNKSVAAYIDTGRQPAVDFKAISDAATSVKNSLEGAASTLLTVADSFIAISKENKEYLAEKRRQDIGYDHASAVNAVKKETQSLGISDARINKLLDENNKVVELIQKED